MLIIDNINNFIFKKGLFSLKDFLRSSLIFKICSSSRFLFIFSQVSSLILFNSSIIFALISKVSQAYTCFLFQSLSNTST